ncbi:MAG: response regulator transcription factor [Bacteroidetes bacterium]|nr:response regulator transcription factor [Bacteroidota bacterium]
MKLIIIDNEIPVRSSIKSLLLKCCPEITTIVEADGVQNGLQSISSFQPDIVLLDVEMDDGTGFDLMRELKNPSFQLIFVTAHNQYAIDAFRFSAIDYLLKPIDPDELQRAIQKAIRQIQNTDMSRQISFLLKQIGDRSEHGKKIVLKDIDNVYFVKVSDILFCEAEGTYTRFHINNAEPILVSKNLKEYEAFLEPLGFIRTHHSYLANPDRIKVFDKTDGGSLYLDNGQSIPVSQRKKESVLALLEGRGS